MKRRGLILACMGLLALPALAEEIVPEPSQATQNVVRPNAAARAQQQQEQQNQGQQRPNAQQQQQNQLRMTISNFYSAKFREAVDLSDDQFIKMSTFIQAFIDTRFNVAMRRDAINQRLEELQSQPNASEADVEELILEKTRINLRAGNLERDLIAKIKPELRQGQAVRILTFNNKFFEEDLPRLIEQVRAQRGQQPVVRPNQNPQNQRQNNKNNPANALRPNKQGQK